MNKRFYLNEKDVCFYYFHEDAYGVLARVYGSGFFEEGKTSDIVVKECQPTNRGVDLEEVCLRGISGYWLKINPNWLKESCGPYRSKTNGLKLFRRDCDSILLFSYEGQEYAVWLELKSGYDSVAGDASFFRLLS